jgi:hypothetical protein
MPDGEQGRSWTLTGNGPLVLPHCSDPAIPAGERIVVFEHPTDGEGDSRRWERSAGILTHVPARARSDVDQVLDAVEERVAEMARVNSPPYIAKDVLDMLRGSRDRIRERLQGGEHGG